MKASPKGILDFRSLEKSLEPVFPDGYDRNKINVPTPEEFLDFLPDEGPFKWEPVYGDEWFPSWDDDRETFHKYDEAIGYERDENGVITITVESFDGEGGTEFEQEWKSDDSSSSWEEMYVWHLGVHSLWTSMAVLHYELWQMEKWCETGECPDPIENFIGDGPSWMRLCQSIRQYNEWAWRAWKELAGNRSPNSWED